MASLQTTKLDYAGVRTIPLLGEFIEGHGDSMVYFSATLREMVPGGLGVSRIIVVTDAAIYKIPQTASETGIFFNSRVPLSNLTQILVIDNAASPCVQFNGIKATTGEQTLFTLEISDAEKKKECMLTLCHLAPDLPILKKSRVDGRFYDVPFVEGLAPQPPPRSPPLTRADEARRFAQRDALRDANELMSGSVDPEKTVQYLLDPSFADDDTSVPEHICAPQDDGDTWAAANPAWDGGPATASVGAGGQHAAGGGGSVGVPQLHAPPPGYAEAPVVDYAFERQKTMLRHQLFDHDLTNLQLRASLSLLEDADGDGDACGAAPATQQAMLGRPSESGTPSVRSFATRRSQSEGPDDPEAQRRRFLMMQEEERQRAEQERERREVVAMLQELDSHMERTVVREAQKQAEVQHRIRARQVRSDRNLNQLRADYNNTRERQRELERQTKAQHKREREAFLRKMESAREALAVESGGTGGGGASAVAVVAPGTTTEKNLSKKTPVERRQEDTEDRRVKDRILLGVPLHEFYMKWRETGGLQQGEGWTPADSEAIVKKLTTTVERMQKVGERSDFVTRVKAIRGNIQRELNMVRGKESFPFRPDGPVCLEESLCSHTHKHTHRAASTRRFAHLSSAPAAGRATAS